MPPMPASWRSTTRRAHEAGLRPRRPRHRRRPGRGRGSDCRTGPRRHPRLRLLRQRPYGQPGPAVSRTDGGHGRGRAGHQRRHAPRLAPAPTGVAGGRTRGRSRPDGRAGRPGPSGGLPVYLLGGASSLRARLSAALIGANSGLLVAGSEGPDLPARPTRDAGLVARIAASGARLVFVGLGCPKQELWMAANAPLIPASCLGVGVAFAAHARLRLRAPLWLQHLGLEWLFRLTQEPPPARPALPRRQSSLHRRHLSPPRLVSWFRNFASVLSIPEFAPRVAARSGEFQNRDTSRGKGEHAP
ncbi:MAG: glycosyltransferase [Alphaproteobacteria bacterium]|nr:glycosyltransferase [Alphaproteobacteria bacterium]